MSTDRNNSNQSERSIAESVSNEFKPGPYVAIVRNHLDSKYMGSLEVELLTSSGSGNSTNTPGQLYSVSYLSPFYGTTPYEGTTENEGPTQPPVYDDAILRQQRINESNRIAAVKNARANGANVGF